MLESLPEQGPRLPQAVAEKNVSVANGAVFDPETIADMTSNLTRLERALYEFARHTYNDHRLWRRIAVPPEPVRPKPIRADICPSRQVKPLSRWAVSGAVLGFPAKRAVAITK